MSKLYAKYISLKAKDSNQLYLFKSGIFYIFLDADAKKVARALNLKLTKFNDTIFKCRFSNFSISEVLFYATWWTSHF